ncbi:MAG: RDD family protein [Gammaproteobacteria bacterium]|jgi:uncharacterized RDD family membrane protein YckC
MTENIDYPCQYAGLVRRMMAIIYDLFLLIALLFVATAIAMVFNQGNAIEPGQPLYPFYLISLVTVSFVFFGWFWTHGGQTLGMKTWKMRLQQVDGQDVGWLLALIRFTTAILSWSMAGTGFLWSLLQPQKRTWHDIASNCVVIDLRAGKKPGTHDR